MVSKTIGKGANPLGYAWSKLMMFNQYDRVLYKGRQYTIISRQEIDYQGNKYWYALSPNFEKEVEDFVKWVEQGEGNMGYYWDNCCFQEFEHDTKYEYAYESDLDKVADPLPEIQKLQEKYPERMRVSAFQARVH